MVDQGTSVVEGGLDFAAEAQCGQVESLWSASVVSRTEARHAGYSDASGASDAERRNRLAGLATICAVVYAFAVTFLIAGLDLPIGWTWLAAGIVALLCFLICRATLT